MSFKRITDLDTPCLVLDLDLFEANLQGMQRSVADTGRHLRPHAKTHKCSEAARRQIEAGAIGICAAKVSEAEALVASGIGGILITGPVSSPLKIERLVGLLERATETMVVVDSAFSVGLLDRELARRGLRMNVLVDLDPHFGRTGVPFESALEFADGLGKFQNLRLAGIQVYAGHLQHVAIYSERREASLCVLREAADIFRSLRKRFPECSIFSTSGTGTVDIDLEIPEITEFQPGSYVCMDEEYLRIGSAANEDAFETYAPALRVLTGVVSANQRGFVTVDAGFKAIYRDGAIPRVFDARYAHLNYEWFGDEYGKLQAPAPGTSLPPLGTVLELVVSHCDPTINLHDRFHLIRNGEVVGEWPINLRGCCR